jgi:hypothetical protein
MALIPLDIPQGVYSIGVDSESKGRWLDANLIRWIDGSMRPVGGWEIKHSYAANVSAKIRSIHAWKDNSFGTNMALATCNKLLYVNASDTVYDITPTSFNAGNDDAVINRSYGGTFYGGYLYGVRRPNTGEFQEADTWSLDNYGEYLVGCCTSDGKLYEWQLSTSTPAAQIANSPDGCKSLVVTEERFIFALAADSNPRKVAWCDRENNTLWTPDATNEAGDIELQTSGEIMCGVRMRGRTLILTNTDAHIATYLGAPFVYGFERAGTACGAASRKTAISVDEGAFWMGQKAFFIFDGSVAKPLKCDVQDKVFDDINYNQISKAFAVHNSAYDEVWWFYPSEQSTEINRYVAYNYLSGYWSVGKLSRTTGIDRGVFDDPIWIDDEAIAYKHERYGLCHGGNMPYAESAPFNIGNGDQIIKATKLIADEKSIGSVDVTFKTKFYPNAEEYSYTYNLEGGMTPVRFSGRQARIRIESSCNNWRIGVFRLDAVAGGKR